MNLYYRDLTKPINEDEQSALSKQIEEEKESDKSKFGRVNNGIKFSHTDKNIRRFLWHYNSLFPNNYLWHLEFSRENLKNEKKLFNKELNKSTKEEDIQRYIKENKKWVIPGSIFEEYNFGHHGKYLFPEQQLGSEYKADYCLLGKNSDGYHIVLVEFENPSKPYMLKSSNTESEEVRKGLTQISDWERWLDSNRSYFLNSMGLTSKGINIPTYRFHYCLVVSRRNLMDNDAKELRSHKISKINNLNIITYDRLLDYIIKY